MKEISLTQGKVALVDDEDFEALSCYEWFAWSDPSGLFYARRNVVLNGKRAVVTMHGMIQGFKGGDHRDGDGLNNQRLNLRQATASQQARNRSKTIGTSSLYKGVSKKGSKYRAYIKLNGKQRHLGYRESEVDAAVLYDDAAVDLFGEFARLNFPQKELA